HARTHSTLTSPEMAHDLRCPVARRYWRAHTPQPAMELMTNFAFVFPGQGSQTVGMGRALAAASPAAAAVFAQADEALGEPISNLAWEGPEDRLNRTENAQPAL